MSDEPTTPTRAGENHQPDDSAFTDFGQFGYGRMDNRVFDQDAYWVNIAGQPFRLENMTEDYRWNVICFLIENAEYFHAHAVLRCASEIAYDAAVGNVSGELMAVALGGVTVFEMGPVEWMESTPLMRRLRRLTPGGNPLSTE